MPHSSDPSEVNATSLTQLAWHWGLSLNIPMLIFQAKCQPFIKSRKETETKILPNPIPRIQRTPNHTAFPNIKQKNLFQPSLQKKHDLQPFLNFSKLTIILRSTTIPNGILFFGLSPNFSFLASHPGRWFASGSPLDPSGRLRPRSPSMAMLWQSGSRARARRFIGARIIPVMKTEDEDMWFYDGFMTCCGNKMRWISNCMNLLYVVKQFKANMVIACYSYIGYIWHVENIAAKIRLSIDYDIISPLTQWWTG